MADEKLDTQIRREQIAEAALALVATSGVRQLSVAAVARRVGLVPSGIYRHFKSKDEILDAVLEMLEKRVLDFVEAAVQETDDPLERLHGVLRRHGGLNREGRAIPGLSSDDVTAANRTQAGVAPDRDPNLGQVERSGRRSPEWPAASGSEINPYTAMILRDRGSPVGCLWASDRGGID